MKELVLKIANASKDDLEQFKSEVGAKLGEENVRLLEAQSFMGIDEIMAVLTIKDSIIIAELASIIIMWLKTRSQKRVKIGEIDITGYTQNEVIKIVNEIETKEDETKNHKS